MASDISLDNLIKRKWPRKLRLETFTTDLPEFEAEIGKTEIGKLIVRGSPLPDLLNEHSVQPPYQPSADILEQEALLSFPKVYQEVNALNERKAQDRRQQTEDFEKLRRSHMKQSLEIIHLHDFLYDGLENEEDQKIKNKIISVQGYDAYKVNFITNKRRPDLLWKWTKKYAEKSLRNLLQGLDLDWQSLTLRNDFLKWWLDVKRVIQAYADLGRPLDDDRKCIKVFNSLTRNSLDKSCLQTSQEIVDAFRTLLLPFDGDEPITWDELYEIVQNHVALLNRQRDVITVSSILPDNPSTSKYNRGIEVNVKGIRSESPYRTPRRSESNERSDTSRNRAPSIERGRSKERNYDRQRSQSPAPRSILKDNNNYKSGDRSPSPAPNRGRSNPRDNQRTDSRDYPQDNNRDYHQGDRGRSKERNNNYSSRESSRERPYYSNSNNNKQYEQRPPSRSNSTDRHRNDTRARSPGPNNQWPRNDSKHNNSVSFNNHDRDRPSNAYRPPHSSQHNNHRSSSSNNSNRKVRVSVHNVETTIPDEMTTPVSTANGISTEVLSKWKDNYNYMQQQDDEQEYDDDVDSVYSDQSSIGPTIQIKQLHLKLPGQLQSGNLTPPTTAPSTCNNILPPSVFTELIEDDDDIPSYLPPVSKAASTSAVYSRPTAALHHELLSKVNRSTTSKPSVSINRITLPALPTSVSVESETIHDPYLNSLSVGNLFPTATAEAIMATARSTIKGSFFSPVLPTVTCVTLASFRMESKESGNFRGSELLELPVHLYTTMMTLPTETMW